MTPPASPTPRPTPTVAPTPTPTPTPTPGPDTAGITVTPGRIETPLGGRFSIRVVVEAGSTNPVDTVQVYLDFDPRKLKALRVRSGSVLEYELQSGFNNFVGQVDYAAGTLSTPLVYRFSLVTVDFLSLEAMASGPATISFVRARPRRTRALLAGMDSTGPLASATVTAK